ncbi:hypothetical protein MVEN_02648700 [Mycena venus]|uniref:Uncharacterized protein n=1 Tax=Mycena venus TaxID=2733690 RepID=A0A8H6TS66_9AGAR|nr:hypothetical protein MVEN_02648700 [Mycena venus]
MARELLVLLLFFALLSRIVLSFKFHSPQGLTVIQAVHGKKKSRYATKRDPSAHTIWRVEKISLLMPGKKRRAMVFRERYEQSTFSLPLQDRVSWGGIAGPSSPTCASGLVCISFEFLNNGQPSGLRILKIKVTAQGRQSHNIEVTVAMSRSHWNDQLRRRIIYTEKKKPLRRKGLLLALLFELGQSILMSSGRFEN